MAEVNREDPQVEPNIVDPGSTQQTQTETQVTEALDPRGVPYKNTVAELERKLNEAAAINQQYQTVLGERQAQQQVQAQPAPVKTVDDDVLSQYSDQDRKAIEIIARKVANEAAEQTGYRFMQQATLQNDLADNTELMEEARKQYGLFKQNQYWAKQDDLLIQDRAVAEAKNVLLAKKSAAANQQAVTDANRAAAQGATLPNTSGQSAVVETKEDREAWINKWQQQWENVAMMKKFHRGVEQGSPEWQKLFREYAEEAWNPTIFSGTSAVGTAYRHLEQQQGTQQERS